MTSGFHTRLSTAGKQRISAAQKASYRGPNGPRRRAIDRANGRKARGHTWKR